MEAIEKYCKTVEGFGVWQNDQIKSTFAKRVDPRVVMLTAMINPEKTN